MEDKKPIKRQKFEVKTYIDPHSGLLRKDVFIDEKLFSWEVDEKAWKNLTAMGPEYVEVAKIEILKHFCDSLSQFLSRKIDPGKVMMAIKTGWI